MIWPFPRSPEPKLVVDRIISLGALCEVAYQARRLSKSSRAYPFDWWDTPLAGLLRALKLGITSASGEKHVTVGADRGFDARDFVEDLRELGATPHVAQNTSGRRSAIDGRTTRHPGYALSIRARKRIEEVFGWVKAAAGQRKTRFRGLPKVRFAFTFAVAAYNLVRLPKLLIQ